MPDPFNPQSLNRYSYCLNNPLKYVDPSGHETIYLDTDEDDSYDWVQTDGPDGVIISMPYETWTSQQNRNALIDAVYTYFNPSITEIELADIQIEVYYEYYYTMEFNSLGELQRARQEWYDSIDRWLELLYPEPPKPSTWEKANIMGDFYWEVFKTEGNYILGTGEMVVGGYLMVDATVKETMAVILGARGGGAYGIYIIGGVAACLTVPEAVGGYAVFSDGAKRWGYDMPSFGVWDPWGIIP